MTKQIELISEWLGSGSINIFGWPFSGKDTQCRKLAELFNGVLISGGDILRSHSDSAEISQEMADGTIIPSDFYLDRLLPYLSQAEFNNKPLLLSSVGRSHGEEPAIMQAAADSGHPMRTAILLKLSETDVWQRLKAAASLKDRGSRQDDNEEGLRNRLVEFHEKTEPVIQFYRDKKLLLEVDGSLTRDEVTNEILNGLSGLSSA